MCTENECTDLVRPLQSETGSNEGIDSFTFMIFMLIAAVILYLIRPNSLRRRVSDLNKPSSDNVSANHVVLLGSMMKIP